MDRFFSLLVRVSALALTAGPAAAVTVSIGTSHFTNGQTVTTGAFLGAVAGQPAPFDSFYGGDVAGPDFSVSWTFNFTAPLAVTGDVELSLGLFDGDFAAAGSQMGVFTFDGVDIATLADAVFEAGPGNNGTYIIATITLPVTVIPALLDGSATVQFSLSGPGLGVLPGGTPNNGAGVDFATLNFTEVPEPSAPLFLGALGVAGLLRRRRIARI